MSIRIAISIGDYNGIGPEVILKALENVDLEQATPVILGSESIIIYYRELFNISLPFYFTGSAGDIKAGSVNVLNALNGAGEIEPGKMTENSGKCAMLAVEKGIQLCLKGQTDALVTAPISKEAVNLAGYKIPGHTEFLAEKTQCKDFMMMLVHDKLRVGLNSIHIPIREVPSTVTDASILRYIRIMHHSLQQDFGIGEPVIALLGLNPHAGDGGVIGREEIEIIKPAIAKARSGGLNVQGPFPADGFFGNRQYERFEGILAMYHDQGLIPFKTLSFGGGVNFTAGLPIIRTSPDHGTAFDIAGKNKANPSSFEQAYRLAIRFAENRKKNTP